jgi:hypothetical protein
VFSVSLLLGRCSLLLVLRRGSRSSHCRFGMVAFLHFATAAAARTFAATTTARAATAALMAATTARTAARATAAALTAAALAATAAAARAVREKTAQAATEATAVAAAATAVIAATAARSTAAVATAAASTAAAEPEGIRGARNGQHGHHQGNTMKVHLTHLHLRNAFACPRRPPCGGPEDLGHAQQR